MQLAAAVCGIFFFPFLEVMNKMRETNNGGLYLDTSAHLILRFLVSQSASDMCCTLSLRVVLNVSHVDVVFMIYCVNIAFTLSELLIFRIVYTIGLLKHGM